MEIQDLNVGVFRNGMVRMMDEIAEGRRSPRIFFQKMRSWVCACYHIYFRSILLM